MRKLILGVVFLMIFSANIYSQVMEDIRWEAIDMQQLYPNSSTTTKAPNQYGIVQGGKYKTASGTIKVPIIFVRFKDDIQSGNNIFRILRFLQGKHNCFNKWIC